MRKFLLIFLILIVGCYHAHRVMNDEKISKSEIVLMHNKERAIKKCDVYLVPDKRLDEVAQKWAEHMAKKNYLYHSNLQINGTEFWMMGENIACGQKDIDSVMKDWMDSKDHRENILNKKFTHIGVGYSHSINGTTYWCVQFGAK